MKKKVLSNQKTTDWSSLHLSVREPPMTLQSLLTPNKTYHQLDSDGLRLCSMGGAVSPRTRDHVTNIQTSHNAAGGLSASLMVEKQRFGALTQ